MALSLSAVNQRHQAERQHTPAHDFARGTATVPHHGAPRKGVAGATGGSSLMARTMQPGSSTFGLPHGYPP